MADVAFSYRAEPHSPRTTMDHPGQWHYVATRLMAHMGTYSRDKMNGLHRRWHQRAALRMRTAMQRHNIWAIAQSPGYQGRASGHKRRRCQEVPEAPGKRHAITPQDATGGHHPGWVPPPAHTEAPSDDSPRGGTKAALIPRDAGRCARTAPENEEPWPIPATQPHAAPAARRVVFHQGMDRGHGGPNDPPAQQTSSVADLRRRSKRPRTERAHIPTIRTPAERARQAALGTGAQQATDGASSSSAASLPGSAAGPLPGGRHATDTRPRGPTADQRPEHGVAGRTPQSIPPQAGRDGTAPNTGTGQLTNWAHMPPTGLPALAATQQNRRGAEDAPQQRGHDAGNPGADEEMTEA